MCVCGHDWSSSGPATSSLSHFWKQHYFPSLLHVHLCSHFSILFRVKQTVCWASQRGCAVWSPPFADQRHREKCARTGVYIRELIVRNAWTLMHLFSTMHSLTPEWVFFFFFCSQMLDNNENFVKEGVRGSRRGLNRRRREITAASQ